MDAIPTHDIVLRTRIREIVHLDMILYAFAYKIQAMLPEHDIVYGPLADKELSFQILCLVYQAGTIFLSPYITSYHFQSMTGPPATATLKISG